MPKTAVGLFKDPRVVDDVVCEIQALGFPRREVRTLEEPKTFETTGLMSFPRLDFEVDLGRELARIGATRAETEVYLENLRNGGVLMFATGRGAEVDSAAALMNRHGAIEVEESFGPEPELPFATPQPVAPMQDTPVMAGRLRRSSEGTCFFVW